MKLNNQTFSLAILGAQGGLPSLCSKQRLFEAWVSFRKVGVFFLAIGLITGSTGCFHPVATMFDSAHSLQEGQSKITVGGTGNPEGAWSNPGGSVLAIYDYGITANRDVRVRFERRMESGSFSVPYAFLEFGHKWSFDNQFAFSLPAQLYFPVANSDDGNLLCVNPRFMFSSNPSGKEFRVHRGGASLSGTNRTFCGSRGFIWICVQRRLGIKHSEA